MVCVRPGVLLTRASPSRPRSALMALDLPTLERPAKAISGAPGVAGQRRGRPRAGSSLERRPSWGAGNSNKIAPFESGESGDEPRTGACRRDVGDELRFRP